MRVSIFVINYVRDMCTMLYTICGAGQKAEKKKILQ